MTPRPKPKTKINFFLDLEFNSIHFGINKRLNQQTFKIVDDQKCLGLKVFDFFKILKKIFLKKFIFYFSYMF